MTTIQNLLDNGHLAPNAALPYLLQPTENAAPAFGLTVDETGWKLHGVHITRKQYLRALRDLGSIWYDTRAGEWESHDNVTAAAITALTRNLQ